MKAAILALALAAAVQAGNFNDVPQCAQPCLADSIRKVTKCQPTDLNCACKPDNFAKVRGDAASCVIGKCGQGRLREVLDGANRACQGHK
ncbi:hypothetical protein CDD83_3322 [Cordyceps sp. RAO-2017]|nr:hypothetical protein CDD83_3322 [Cordyceps sp. RAO-2017]